MSYTCVRCSYYSTVKNDPILGLGNHLWHVETFANGNSISHPCRTVDEWKQFYDQIEAWKQAVANNPDNHMDIW